MKNLSARGTPARATSPTSTAKRSDYALVAPSVMSDMMGDGDESDPDSSSGEDETVEEIFAPARRGRQRLAQRRGAHLRVAVGRHAREEDGAVASQHHDEGKGTRRWSRSSEPWTRTRTASCLSTNFGWYSARAAPGRRPSLPPRRSSPAKNKKAMNAELGGMRAELDKLRDMMSSLLVNPAETQLNQMRALLEDIVVRTSPESSVKTAADSTSTAYDGWALGDDQVQKTTTTTARARTSRTRSFARH